MKKLILSLIILISAVSLQAADRSDAVVVCNRAAFSSDRDTCINNLRNFDYFDSAALSVCSRIVHSDEYPTCINTIGDKTYENYETNNCLKQVHGDDKIMCLRTAGRRYSPPQRYDHRGRDSRHSHDHDRRDDRGRRDNHGDRRDDRHQHTLRYEQVDFFRAPKLRSDNRIIPINKEVELIRITALEADVVIQKVVVVFTNGRTFDILELVGTFSENRSLIYKLQTNARVEKIEITSYSPNLRGSRGQLKVEVAP